MVEKNPLRNNYEPVPLQRGTGFSGDDAKTLATATIVGMTIFLFILVNQSPALAVAAKWPYESLEGEYAPLQRRKSGHSAFFPLVRWRPYCTTLNC
jgi:hypothetical protein